MNVDALVRDLDVFPAVRELRCIATLHMNALDKRLDGGVQLRGLRG